jgi:hypothetical protein
MNEKIQELWDKAAESTKDDSWQSHTLFMERFAELIIQECMNAVCDPRTTYLESMTDSSAMYVARERIRKHFRVKS